MKTLISWVATMHDFSRNPETKQINGVNENGPTFNFTKISLVKTDILFYHLRKEIVLILILKSYGLC
jgi:hypothetical protein